MRKNKVESNCKYDYSDEVLDRYVNGDRMYVRLNGEPLEEVDCFKYLGSQEVADQGCEMDVIHRSYDSYKA